MWRHLREKNHEADRDLCSVCLNRDNVSAPRGAAWAANTLNGTRNKGTGLLRVPIYRGVIVWNKVRYVRDRTARHKTQSSKRMENIGRPSSSHN
jgi:hypothetical protein